MDSHRPSQFSGRHPVVASDVFSLRLVESRIYPQQFNVFRRHSQKMSKSTIIFFSSGDSVRSQMAAGFASALCGDDTHVYSAGYAAADPVHPLAIETMGEYRIDISTRMSTLIRDMGETDFDLAINLSSDAQENCNMLSGTPAIIEWHIQDPLADHSKNQDTKKTFRRCAEIIRLKVADLFNQGYFDAFVAQQNNLNSVLNSVSDALIAHDMQRRIFFFSEGAEKLTGMSRSQVIGKDCNIIFKPRLCGENCSFCFGPVSSDFKGSCYPSVFYDPEGNRKDLEVNVIPLKNTHSEITGVIAAMSDVSKLKSLERELKQTKGFRGIIGSDPKMIQLFEQIRDLASFDYPVHIHGETGVGKELVAKAIHDESARSNDLFVPINCGALPEGLVESELFGHEKGSFSGAIRSKKGRFELAHKGTIFLDEVADLPKSVQVKLLRFLQEGTLEKVGSEGTVTVDVRVLSATNKDLLEETRKGNFREDLYYRLNVIPLKLPPLRKRKNDILPLCEHFLNQATRPNGHDPHNLSPEALSVMMDYHWPGNIRELENAVRFSVFKNRNGIIYPEDLPLELQKVQKRNVQKKPDQKLDTAAVKTALIKTGGNKAKAARLLGVGRATIYRFLNQHPDISVD